MKHLLLFLLLLPFSSVFGALPAPREYRLRLFHTHTLEHLDIVYRRGDTYDPAALSKLDLFLRDWRQDKVKHYDPRLFDLLTDLETKVDKPGAEIHIICGYRTPATNTYLRNNTKAVAQHSLHMEAEAIDIRLPGVPTARLRDSALALHRGGVGYYRGSDFVHVDVGRVRRW